MSCPSHVTAASLMLHVTLFTRDYLQFHTSLVGGSVISHCLLTLVCANEIDVSVVQLEARSHAEHHLAIGTLIARLPSTPPLEHILHSYDLFHCRVADSALP